VEFTRVFDGDGIVVDADDLEMIVAACESRARSARLVGVFASYFAIGLKFLVMLAILSDQNEKTSTRFQRGTRSRVQSQVEQKSKAKSEEKKVRRRRSEKKKKDRRRSKCKLTGSCQLLINSDGETRKIKGSQLGLLRREKVEERESARREGERKNLFLSLYHNSPIPSSFDRLRRRLLFSSVFPPNPISTLSCRSKHGV
jgi:hypothetical protein